VFQELTASEPEPGESRKTDCETLDGYRVVGKGGGFIWFIWDTKINTSEPGQLGG